MCWLDNLPQKHNHVLLIFLSAVQRLVRTDNP